MVNFEFVDLTTGTDLYNNTFNTSLISLNDPDALVNYANSIANDVLEALDTENPFAIQFFNDGKAFEKTNNSEFLTIESGNLVNDKSDAMEVLLNSFYTFICFDGYSYLDSLAQAEEFGLTEQDLTANSNADLLVSENQTATDNNWDVNSVKINNPISFKMLDDKGNFNIRSLYMNNLSGVKVVADLGETSLVLAKLDVNPFDDNDYSLKLAKESGVYADLEGNKYFVPTEKYSELTNFRLEIDDAGYQALNDIETQWVVHFRKGLNADQDQVRKNVMMLTNLAYFFQSDELSTVLDNYEAISGEKFYKYQEFKDSSGGKVPTGFTEEQIAYDFSDPAQKEKFFNLMGVRSNKIGENGYVSSFTWSEDNLQGQGTTWGRWFDGELRLGAGDRISMRPEYNTTKNEIVSTQALHEFGHLFGYTHYSSFCYGEAVDFGPRVLYSLVNLMGEAGLLPYDTLNYSVERCGFNQVEKFIYENGDKFPELHQYLESVKEQRNAAYDAVVPQIRKWENEVNSMPAFLRQAYLTATNTTAPIEKYLNVQDKGAYQVTGNTSCFYKL